VELRLTRFDIGGKNYEVRFTRYDLRGTIYEVRFTIKYFEFLNHYRAYLTRSLVRSLDFAPGLWLLEFGT